jgi:hypothetical protein
MPEPIRFWIVTSMACMRWAWGLYTSYPSEWCTVRLAQDAAVHAQAGGHQAEQLGLLLMRGKVLVQQGTEAPVLQTLQLLQSPKLALACQVYARKQLGFRDLTKPPLQ